MEFGYIVADCKAAERLHRVGAEIIAACVILKGAHGGGSMVELQPIPCRDNRAEQGEHEEQASLVAPL